MASLNLEGLKNVTVEMFDHMKCFNCNIYPRKGNIYKCSNFHTICEQCSGLLKKCRCGQAYLEDTMSEKLRLLLPMPCKNYLYGCKEFMLESSIEALLDHESGCDYRLINCNNISNICCYSKVPYHGFLEHMEHNMDDHRIDIIPEDMISTLDIPYYKDTKMISKFGRTFFLVTKECNDFLFRWIYLLGSVDEAKYFNFAGKIAGPHDRQLTYEGPVMSIDVDYEAVIKEGNCFCIGTDSFYKSFDMGSGITQFQVDIRYFKEESIGEQSGINEFSHHFNH